MPHITCREFIEFLMAYLDQELPVEQAHEFDQHLAVCPPCVDYLRTYRGTVAAARQAFSDPEAAVPGDVPEELVQAILAAARKREA